MKKLLLTLLLVNSLSFIFSQSINDGCMRVRVDATRAWNEEYEDPFFDDESNWQWYFADNANLDGSGWVNNFGCLAQCCSWQIGWWDHTDRNIFNFTYGPVGPNIASVPQFLNLRGHYEGDDCGGSCDKCTSNPFDNDDYRYDETVSSNINYRFGPPNTDNIFQRFTTWHGSSDYGGEFRVNYTAPRPTVTASTTQICSGSTSSVTLNLSGAIFGGSYQIFDGATLLTTTTSATFVVNINTSKTYRVFTRNNGQNSLCYSEITITAINCSFNCVTNGPIAWNASFDASQGNSTGTAFTTPGNFPANSYISDVNVSINFRKTDGTCASPATGNPFHNETHFRLNAPYAGALATTSLVNGNTAGFTGTNVLSGPVTINFDQSATIAANGHQLSNASNGLSLIPVGNLNQWQWQPINTGSWSVWGGDNATGDPLCTNNYSLTVCGCKTADFGIASVNGNSAGITVCSNSGGTVVLSHNGSTNSFNNNGYGDELRWFSGSCGGTFIGSGLSIVVPTPTVSTTYYAMFYVNGERCRNSNSFCESVTVNVDATTVPGVLAPSNQTICVSTSPSNIVLSGHSGNVVRWEYSSDGGGSWVTASGSSTSTSYSPVAYAGIAGTHAFRAIIGNGVCPQVSSDIAFLQVNANPTAGNVAANQTTVCSGNPIVLNANAFVGEIQWQVSSVNASTGFTNISGQTSPNFSTSITNTGSTSINRWYRIVVTNSPCAASVLSAPVQITIDPVTVGGTPVADESTVCVGNSTSITLSGQVGSVLNWERSINGGAWTSIGNAGSTTISSGTLSTVGTTSFRANLSSGVCAPATSATATINVLPNHSIVLTSLASTENQSLCINIPIVNITYSLGGGATGATVTGLPTGVTSNISGSTLTISGTPSVSGNFNYSIVTTGNACVFSNATGTINVLPDHSISLASASGTNNQELCFGSPITSIVYSTSGGASNVTVSGLPTGVSATFSGSTLTISGAPTVTGLFNYTVSTTGNSCVPASTLGTIEIFEEPTNTISSNQSVCLGDIPSTLNGNLPSGGNGAFTYQWQSRPASSGTFSNISGATFPNYSPLAITESTVFRRIVSSGPCQIFSNEVLINAVPFPVISNVSNTNVLCNGNSTASITITSPDAFEYSIDNGTTFQTGFIFNGLPAGSYNVFVRNSNNCVTEYTSNPVVISEPAPLILNTNVTEPSCDNTNNGVIQALPSGGVPNYEYSLNGGPYQSNATFSNLGAGTYSLSVRDNNLCITSISVTLNPQYSFDLTVDSLRNVGCPGSADGYVELIVSGGQAPFTYSSNNINFTPSPIFENLVAGSYTFFARDVNGCSDAITVNITESAPVQIDVDSVVNVACNGDNTGAVYISPDGSVQPYSYEWRKDGVVISTSEDLVGVTAGVYNVTVSTSNSCQTTISVQVSEPSRLNAIINTISNTTCNGGTGSIEVNVTGGTPGYTFVWEDALNNVVGNAEDLTGAVAGTYTLTVTDENNCTTTVSGTITEPTQLTATASLSNPTCGGTANGSITVTASNGTAPYTYSLNGGAAQSNNSFANLIAGTYTIVVRDANNCSVTLTETLVDGAAFTLSVSSQTNVSCSGQNDGSVTLGTVGGQTPIEYSSNGINYQASNVFNNLPAGLYTFYARDINGCIATVSATISSNPPLILTLNSTTNVLCNGDATGAISVSATGGQTPYEFSINGGTPQATGVFTGLTAGSYNVLVEDANNCTQTLSVTISEPTVLASTVVSVSNVLCNGGTGSITTSVTGGTPSYTYSWTDASNTVVGTSQNLTGAVAGTYTLTVTDANNCTTTVSGTITEPTQLTATAALSNPTCGGTANGSITVTASNGTAPYTFSLNGGAAQSNNSFANLLAGTYTIVVRDANNCSVTLTETLVDGAAFTLSVSSQTNVSCSGQNDGSVTLGTVGGQTPIEYSSNGINYQASNVFNNLPAGLYTFYARDINGCIATVSATISSNPPLILTLNSTTNVLCNGDATGAISVSATGGQTPYEFSINGGTPQTTGVFTGLTAGSYNVLVEDANNCSQTLSVTISEPTVLASTVVSVSNVLCNGGTGSITTNVTGGTPSYTYSWSDASNTVVGTSQNLTGVVAGTYTLTVTDANNCTTTVSGAITEPTQLTATASLSNPTCGGTANGSITVTASNGTAPYTFSLNGGAAQSNNSFANLIAGTYTIVVRDANNCSVTLTETLVDGAAFTLSVSSQTNVSCSGQNDGSVTLGTVGGQTPIEYSSNGINYQASNVFNNLPAGLYTFYARDINGCIATVSATISSNPPLVVVVDNVEDVLCNSQNSGSIEISVTGGSGTYTYTWSNGSSSQNLINVGAGTYNVVVADGNGCTANASATISQPTLLSASIASVTNATCNGASNGAIQVNVTGGTTPYSFAWNNTATTQNINNLTAGTYSLTIEDVNGCFVTVSATVNQPVALSATSVISNPTCGGTANGSITVTASNGTAPYTYSLNGGAAQSNNSFANLIAGTYTIEVRDANNCSVTLTETLVDGAAFTLSVSSQTNVSCSGQNDGSVTLTTVGGQTPIEYSSNGINYQASNVFNNLPAGLYTFYARDINGCIATVSATISSNPPLVISLNSTTNVLCHGDATGAINVNATGGQSPYTFTLNGGTPQASGTFNGLTAGSYNVVVEDANGCSESISVNISQPNPLSLVIAAFGNASCSGVNSGFVDVSIGGGLTPYSFSWSNGTTVISTSEDISGLDAGTYTLTVTDGNGCIATISQTIVIPAPLTGTLSTTNENCFGDGTGTATANILGGTPPYTYLWSTFDTSATVTGLQSGTISVIVRDSNGCELFLTGTISGPAAPLTISLVRKSDVTCFDGSDGSVLTSITGGTPPYTITWSTGTSTTNQADDLPAGFHTMTVQDANGCITSASFTINQPPQIITSISVTNPTCFGNATGMALIGASGGNPPFTYEWNTTPVQTGALANNLAGDTSYIVKVTDSKGCEVFDTAQLVYPAPLSITTISTSVSCLTAANGEVAVEVTGGNAPYTYQLNGFMQVDSVFEGLDVGTYIVFVVDNNNCSAFTQFEIDGASSLGIDLVGAGNTGIFQSGQLFIARGEEVQLDVEFTNITNNNIVEYIWSPADIDASGCANTDLCQNPVISPASTVWVIVEVVEEINGSFCVVTDSLLIDVSQEARVFIPTAFSPNKDPDCINEHFEINILGASNLDVRIFNRWGEEVFHNPNQQNGPIDPSDLNCSNPRNAWDGTFKGKPVPTGSYVYQIEVTYFDSTKEYISGTITVIR